MTDNSKKSGIITIIGEVNVGKSTLLNILVKKNISIITHKSNTTTKQIKGINDIDVKNVYLVDNMSSTYYEGIKNSSYALRSSLSALASTR